MTLFIDGDAFPNLLKPIVLRAIERACLETYVIANKKINVGKSSFIRYMIVEAGADEADNKIVELLKENDLVITADIPLASEIVKLGALAINPRGELYDEDNINERLSMRDFMTELREGGLVTGGPDSYGPKDKANFTNSLNRILVKKGFS